MAPKHPIDILQSMINGILIETGRALKSADKESTKSFAGANARLRSTIPSAVENFHQALDDLETDIVRAKAVFLRDLEEMRAKRLALEAPVDPLPESIVISSPSVKESPGNTQIADTIEPDPNTVLAEEKAKSASPVNQVEIEQQPHDSTDKSLAAVAGESSNTQQPTPPGSNTNAIASNKPIGLGINTEGSGDINEGPETAGAPNSSIDSLFDAPENDDVTGGNEFNLGDTDFSLTDNITNTQNVETSQPHTEFDLSTFGTATQDFSMTDVQDTDGNITNNTNALNANQDINDLLDLGDSGGGDTMDLDLGMDLGMADESTFDDMFFASADDTNMGGGEMEHQFDSAFFGVE